MDKVVKFELKKDELEKAALKFLYDEEFEKSLFFINKAIEKYNDPQDRFYLAEIYKIMEEYDYSNKILFKLYSSLKDDNLLIPITDNLFKQNDFISVIKYIRNTDIDVQKIDSDNIESMQRFSQQFDMSNPFSVIYPPNDTYFLGVLNYAKLKSQNGEFAEANSILDFRDYSFLQYYHEAIMLKSQNLILMGKISELIDYCYTLISGKYEAYARLYLVYCYNAFGFLGSAKVQIDRLFELELDDEILIDLTKVLGETEFLDESLKVAEIFTKKYPYSGKALTYKASVLYLLGDSRQAIKYINFCENLYGSNFETYFLKEIFGLNLQYQTLNELLYGIYDVAETFVKTTLKNPKRKKIVQTDVGMQKVLGYCLRSNNANIIKYTMKLLEKNYCPKISKIFKDALLDNGIENNTKSSILKDMVLNDNNKVINCVFDNFFTTFDYNLPKELKSCEKNVIDGYYRAVLFCFIASVSPYNDIEKIQKRIKVFMTKINGIKDCPLKKHNSRIIGALMCYDENDIEMLGNLDIIERVFSINKNNFYKIYKKCKQFLEE